VVPSGKDEPAWALLEVCLQTHVPIEGRRFLRRADGEIHTGVVRLTQLPSGSVKEFLVSADGSQVLYLANPGPATTSELFRGPADGSSPPVRLSNPLGLNRTVTSFALSPDQSRVVYLADELANDVFEIFSVPFAGGPVLRLDPLPSFADVSSFRIDVRSERVVFLANRNSAGDLELFTVPLDGSAAAKRLSDPPTAGGDVQSDYLPLRGGRTLYRADQGTNDVLELFVSLERPVLPR